MAGPQARTDERIKSDVVEHLRWDGRVDASRVIVEVDEGEVTLGGTVPTYSAHRAACQVAEDVRGVTSVHPAMRIDHPPGGAIPTDAQIREEARSLLDWSAGIDASVIEVAVDHGQVTLAGAVDALSKKARVEELASALRGVSGVRNFLVVVPHVETKDARVQETIVAALRRHAAVDATGIEVSVEEGQATLSGAVESAAVRVAARLAAMHTDGVVGVTDKLYVPRPDGAPEV
jgi:osmotically-inducible protein OsmY